MWYTVRYAALEIAYKKFTGDFGLDFLAHLRNQVGGSQGPDFLRQHQVARYMLKYVAVVACIKLTVYMFMT